MIRNSYRYDGKFAPNSKLIGSWKAIATVKAIDDFNPTGKYRLERPLVEEIELRDNGGTDSPGFLWSGDILMDLDRSQTLKITPKILNGGDFLFIEAGGFNPKNPVGWIPQWMVLNRN